MDTVLNKNNFDWNFINFNPIVYDKEPYDYDTYADEFLSDYLTGISYLLQTYEETHNEYYKMLAERLMPVGMKNPSN